MKKVIVADWHDYYGGSERVIKSICNIFSIEKYYTLINLLDPEEKRNMLNNQDIRIVESPLRFFGKKFRYLFFSFQYFVKRIKIDKSIDVIISSSHSIAKGVKKSRDNQIHISYFQARNFKHIWDEYELYFGKLSMVLTPLIRLMRKQDIRQAQNPDYIIANSNYVRDWVKKRYNRDAFVIYPPVDLDNFKLEEHKESYYVTVGRLEPYKRFDLVIKAFNAVGEKLVVIGDGSQYHNLKKTANNNIEFLGFLESTEVFKYISKAKGFIHAGVEDFGIAPVEAQACGTPVVGYNYGGLKETVLNGETGILFNQQNISSLIEAIERFEATTFTPNLIRKNALRFSKERFDMEFKNLVENLISLPK